MRDVSVNLTYEQWILVVEFMKMAKDELKVGGVTYNQCRELEILIIDQMLIDQIK